MYENRVLRKIFGCKREEVKGDWRKLHNEKLLSSPNIRVIKSRRMMSGACGMYVGEERCIQSFGGKPERKRSLGRPRRRWEYNIKIHVKSFGKAWTGLIWLRIGTSGVLL
jgi:hypothetical protein